MSPQQVAELYRRYGALIYSRLRRVLKDEGALEEATVAAFRRLVRKGPVDDRKVIEFLRSLG